MSWCCKCCDEGTEAVCVKSSHVVYLNRARKKSCVWTIARGDRTGCSSGVCSSGWVVVECCQHTWEEKVCGILQMDVLSCYPVSLEGFFLYPLPLVSMVSSLPFTSEDLRAHYSCQCAVEWSMVAVFASLWPRWVGVYLSPFFSEPPCAQRLCSG